MTRRGLFAAMVAALVGRKVLPAVAQVPERKVLGLMLFTTTIPEVQSTVLYMRPDYPPIRGIVYDAGLGIPWWEEDFKRM